LKAASPNKAGTVYQPQGQKPGSRRLDLFAVGESHSKRNNLTIDAARGEIALAAFCSTIQTKFHVVPTKGGLLSNSQDAQPRIFLPCGSRPQTAETQSSLFYKSGGNK
jgi:hypothetical protein